VLGAIRIVAAPAHARRPLDLAVTRATVWEAFAVGAALILPLRLENVGPGVHDVTEVRPIRILHILRPTGATGKASKYRNGRSNPHDTPPA
jgi:hypothetical protein